MSPRRSTVRPATAADYQAFAELFGELVVDEPVMSFEHFEAVMLTHTVIAEEAGSTLGYAVFRPMSHTVHLSQLVTEPMARCRGIGGMLLREVARRSLALGCTAMTLNVRSTNLGAIRLYERFGLARLHRNRALAIQWSAIDNLPPASTPFVEDVREIDPSHDPRLELEHALERGAITAQREHLGRVFRAIPSDVHSTMGVFDPALHGVRLLRAPDARHALSLLKAFRPFVPSDHRFVMLLIENDPVLADALVGAGAVQRDELFFMRGSITADVDA